MTKIAIASDHAGYRLKEVVKTHLTGKGHQVEDFGTNSDEPVDYPDFVRPAALSVAEGGNDLGIVLGGSGNGEAMVANKVTGNTLCRLLEQSQRTPGQAAQRCQRDLARGAIASLSTRP